MAAYITTTRRTSNPTTPRDAPLDLGKRHISVRYEPGPRLVRVGACIANYTWETQESVMDALLDFEESHADDFAVEFDVIPIDGITDQLYDEA
jgi:hypothetical protein